MWNSWNLEKHLFICLLFEKKFFLMQKRNIFYLRPKCMAWRQKGGGLERCAEMVSWDLKGILHIRRLWRSFCGAHGSPATPSSWDNESRHESVFCSKFFWKRSLVNVASWILESKGIESLLQTQIFKPLYLQNLI